MYLPFFISLDYRLRRFQLHDEQANKLGLIGYNFIYLPFAEFNNYKVFVTLHE
ncbi:MAG: hypothetical protein RIQ62_608 [Bacteroidota bacterium]|jgi:hypothetical protein